MRFFWKHSANLYYMRMQKRRNQTSGQLKDPVLKQGLTTRGNPRSPGVRVCAQSDRQTNGWPHKKTWVSHGVYGGTTTRYNCRAGHRTQRAKGGLESTLMPVWHQAKGNGATRTGGGNDRKEGIKNEYKHEGCKETCASHSLE